MPIRSEAATAALKAAAADTITVDQPMLTKEGAAKMMAGHCTHHLKTFWLLHSVGLSLAGGLLIGLATFHLANKFLLSKKDTAG